MATPLVSIIIPCHNAAPWLADTIASALGQTWPKCEIIVVDDGSTDESLSIAKQFKSQGVIVLHQPNKGAAAARNTGLRSAEGDYIQFLDADDLLAPTKIEEQLKLLIPDKPAILSSGLWAHFTLDPREAKFSEYPNYRDLSGVEFLQLHWETGCMMQPGAWLAPRALLQEAGPWNESLSLNDDGEYFARVMLRAKRIAFCRESKTYYRTHQGKRLSARRDRRALESLFQSVTLTTSHLLAVDKSARSRAAVAYAWKWTAYELYPGAPDLSDRAVANSEAMGGSERRYPGGGRFQLTARLLGWRLAKRLCG